MLNTISHQIRSKTKTNMPKKTFTLAEQLAKSIRSSQWEQANTIFARLMMEKVEAKLNEEKHSLRESMQPNIAVLKNGIAVLADSGGPKAFASATAADTVAAQLRLNVDKEATIYRDPYRHGRYYVQIPSKSKVN